MIRRFPIVLQVFLFTIIHTGQAQTLFTYGSKTVSKDEFLRAYGKNSTGEKPTEISYREYFDLFSKFKIKVQAALDMKLDTLDNLKAELQNFRSQVMQNYLNDEESIHQLVDEAYARSQKDIQLSHIFIQIRNDDSAAKIKIAESKINKAYELLKHSSFEQVALEFSEDPSVKVNKGDIGYITVFVLPYHLETAAYNLSPGQYSRPLRSATGLHIFKKTNERKAVGRIRTAQILLAFPPDITNAQQGVIKKTADSLRKALMDGADFKALALQYSNDNISYQNGGELPEFGVGRYDRVFENAAFSLQKDGDITTPIRSDFGYHIIKRLSHTPAKHDEANQQWRENLRQQIMQADRMEVSRKKLLSGIQQKTNYKKLPYNEKSLWRLTDSVIANKSTPKLADLNLNTALFSFTKEVIRVKDWQNYLESVRNIPSLVTGKSNAEIFEQFIETSALDYYRNHLEEFNQDFVFQVNEFKEGNLLFEVMQRKIWEAASQDSAALKNYYQKNKNKYWWENSASAIIFTCSDEQVAEDLK
ncbi:MAG: peptidylprolyl isomerase, partial [Flavitalea sp.]